MKSFLFYLWQRIHNGRVDRIVPFIGLYLRLLHKSGFQVLNSNKVPVDIIIPTIAKDYALLEVMISSLKKIEQTIDKIYIVSRPEQEIINFCRNNNYVFIDEKSVLGYGKDKIEYKSHGHDRSGWIFQQLIKLSGDKISEKRKLYYYRFRHCVSK